MRSGEAVEHERFIGEEFMLWLWMRGLEEGGASGLDDDKSACFLADVITLVSERGDVKELNLSKGNPSESLEAFEALSRGMRPHSARLRLLADGMEWVFMLAAEKLEVSSLKLPPVQAKDPAGQLSERIFLLEECISHLERRFTRFLTQRCGDTEGVDGLEGEMRAWIENGLGNT